MGSYKIKIQLADIKANINANPGFSLYYNIFYIIINLIPGDITRNRRAKHDSEYYYESFGLDFSR